MISSLFSVIVQIRLFVKLPCVVSDQVFYNLVDLSIFGESRLDLQTEVNYHRASLHINQMAHQAGAYPGCCDTKRLGSISISV